MMSRRIPCPFANNAMIRAEQQGRRARRRRKETARQDGHAQTSSPCTPAGDQRIVRVREREGNASTKSDHPVACSSAMTSRVPPTSRMLSQEEEYHNGTRLKHPVQSIGFLLHGKHLARVLLHITPPLPQMSRLVRDAQRDHPARSLHHARAGALSPCRAQTLR